MTLPPRLAPEPHFSERIIGNDKGTAALVYRSLMHDIHEGIFKAGDKLPNERDLAKRFATSRSTIRNVLALMSSHGLITRKVGSGSFLSERISERASAADLPVAAYHQDVPSFSEILEGRLLFEPAMMDLVAKRGEAKDFALMRHHLLGIAEANEWLRYKEHIYSVHQAIFAATGNRFLIQIFENIAADRRAVQYDGRAGLDGQVNDIVREQTLKELSLIVDALEARNGKRATRLMHDYFLRISASLNIYG